MAEIINVKSIKTVLILVGFHLIMSFLGSIGKLMKGSEISEALQTVYGKNAVEHMMSGKAVRRAIRGIFARLQPCSPTYKSNIPSIV